MRVSEGRIGVHSGWDLDDAAAWSGVIAPMVRAMESTLRTERLVVDVPADAPVDRLRARLSSRTVLPAHSPATARRRSSRLAGAVHRTDVDAVVALAASTDLVRDPGAPVVQVTDATFDAVAGFYPQFSGLSRGSLRRGRRVERLAARSTAHYLVATDWAARSLIDDVGVDAGHVSVAPFGPAIAPPSAPSDGHADRSPGDLADPRPTPRGYTGALRLLFVAGAWERKNGEAALRIVRELGRTRDVELTIVGSAPTHAEAVGTVLGRVDRSQLSALYSSHDVLLEPARANASGVVITDALHHGLPVLASDVGGVSTLVRPGVGGWLVPLYGVVDASVDALSDVEPATLRALSRTAAEDARRRLTWSAWVAALGGIDL